MTDSLYKLAILLEAAEEIADDFPVHNVFLKMARFCPGKLISFESTFYPHLKTCGLI